MKKLLVVLIALTLSGCAGEVYLGARRIDEYKATQTMHDKPLKCLFVSCNQEGEAHGS